MWSLDLVRAIFLWLIHSSAGTDGTERRARVVPQPPDDYGGRTHPILPSRIGMDLSPRSVMTHHGWGRPAPQSIQHDPAGGDARARDRSHRFESSVEPLGTAARVWRRERWPSRWCDPTILAPSPIMLLSISWPAINVSK